MLEIIILQAGIFFFNFFIFPQNTSSQQVRMLTWTEIPIQRHCSYGENYLSKEWEKDVFCHLESVCFRSRRNIRAGQFHSLNQSEPDWTDKILFWDVCLLFVCWPTCYFSLLTAQMFLFEVLSPKKISNNNNCISLKHLTHC